MSEISLRRAVMFEEVSSNEFPSRNNSVHVKTPRRRLA